MTDTTATVTDWKHVYHELSDIKDRLWELFLNLSDENVESREEISAGVLRGAVYIIQGQLRAIEIARVGQIMNDLNSLNDPA